MRRILVGFMVGILSLPAIADDAAVVLDRHEVIDLVFDKTLECRREKDQALCTNFMSAEGVVVRVMIDDGARKEGVWFVDDKDRLCILWRGTLKPLCFKVYESGDGSYNLTKKGKHITTLLGVREGNPGGL